MASATDIITYIGVPLAVLGVTPIFYTFLSALLTKLKLQRTLRRNGIECPIRAKLMTGTVEVELPVYHLTTRARDSPGYWSPSRLKAGIEDASWSCHNFHTTVSQWNTIRFQRSDKIVLPAADIIFTSLLHYLLDIGYTLDQEGFHTLRTRGQQTSEGTVLMYMKSGRSLVFARPGIRHGSIALTFSEPPRSAPYSISNQRDPSQYLPPFYLTGPLLENQGEASPANENPTATNEGPAVSTDANETYTTDEKRHYFVMKWTTTVGLEISIHETLAPSIGFELPRDHILCHLHPDNDILTCGTPWGEPLNWFACAAIAVYGFHLCEATPFYVFSPNERFLQTVQRYHLDVSTALLHGLVQRDTTSLHELLKYVDVDPYDPKTVGRIGNSQEAQLVDRLAKEWMTRSDLSQWEFEASRLRRLQRFGFERHPFEHSWFNRRMDMPNLLRMCIRSLLSHPMRLKSLLIGSLPQEPTNLDHITQHVADQILRMMILDNEFAKGIRAQTHQLLKSPLPGALEAIQARKKEKQLKKLDREYSVRDALIEGLRCSQEDTHHFCCAVVLLGVIRHRADYLRSGDDIRQCVNDWPTVNLS